MMALWKIVSFIFLLRQAESKNCEDLAGNWYNSLGSEMILVHNENGELSGEYRTAVERKAGSAGTSHSNLTGAAPYNKPGATIGLMVSWRGGKSTTVWTGQCIVCDGDEVIITSWLLRALVNTCIDKWKSTYIGQDYFTRSEQALGPRKRFGTHTPQGYQPDGDSERRKRALFDAQLVREVRVRRQTGRKPCTLDGNWYNLIGSRIELKEKPDHSIEGEYYTAREILAEKQGKHSRIYGVGNHQTENHTFAILVSWNKGASLTGWVGQCHICMDSNNVSSELLEMAWLHRREINSCAANWKSTLHGQNTFYRKVQVSDALVSSDVIGEFGEETDDTNAAKSNRMSTLLFLCASFRSIYSLLG